MSRIIFLLVIGNHIIQAQYDNGEGELNDSCTSERDCRSFGYMCKLNTCQCEQWYIPDKDKKMCVGGVDRKCLYDEHCIDGAYCMNQIVCKCKRNRPLPLDQGFICSGANTSISFLIESVIFVLFSILVFFVIMQ
ncbi:hypothetical protein FQA39_LY13171 [Lamprigera yunnana]|nr:hypothetical protein FQA39_LY13171 [Lamprigera yunnana]